jgi:predicted PurR-regulated permease PerM
MISNPLGIPLPFIARISLFAVGLYAIISMLYTAQGVLLPIIYAGVTSILISPVVDFMERKGINRIVAIMVILLLVVALVVGVIALISWQMSALSDAWPELKARGSQIVNDSVRWLSHNLNISTYKLNTWIATTSTELAHDNRAMVGHTISSVSEAVATIFLTPVYIFLMVLYKPHLLQFAHRLSGKANDERTRSILNETRVVVRSYLVGLSIEMLILAVLNIAGLLLLGIKYAILLGIIGALLNIIPYVGGLVAVLLFMMVALITGTPLDVLYVFLLFISLQFIDNNFIVPKIVGSKVKLNPLASVLAVIAGAELWGIPGMFLSIPLLAIVKLVFDRISPLEHWGFLLGDPITPLLLKKKS